MAPEAKELDAMPGQELSSEQIQTGDVKTFEPETTRIGISVDEPVKPETATATATESPAEETKQKAQRIGFTLDIQQGKIDEYIAHHATPRPEIVGALRSVGIRNLSLWYHNGTNRLFYYAEYVGTKPLDEAMEDYSVMPGVAEWENLMRQFQSLIPGTDPNSDVWWQPCTQVYHQD